MACVVARMWASLKAPSKLDPRCPEVPKETCCEGSAGSGSVVKYAVTRAATSIRSSGLAGCPARLELMALILARIAYRGRSAASGGAGLLSPRPGRDTVTDRTGRPEFT